MEVASHQPCSAYTTTLERSTIEAGSLQCGSEVNLLDGGGERDGQGNTVPAARYRAPKTWTRLKRKFRAGWSSARGSGGPEIPPPTSAPRSLSPSIVPPQDNGLIANLNQSITSVTSVVQASFEPTVLRRSSLKGRISIQAALDNFDAALHTSSSSGQSSDPSFGTAKFNTGGCTFSVPDNDSACKTSVNSNFPKESTGSSGEKKKPVRRSPARSSPPEVGGLGTIEETGLERATIVTVERAAAAKIYLETYYNDLLTKPQPRSLRRQKLELDMRCYPTITFAQKEAIRRVFYEQERWNLREMRALKWQSTQASRGEGPGPCLDDFELVKTLGKGSFGVVRLVREKRSVAGRVSNQVYAMKVIRKSENIRSSQEGHLRAERDLLVASEDSNWIVSLIASFQDEANLYLVMEYMPGGDFLGLLIRENTLPEESVRFYIAEMILAVEETHRLKCIHRDIKPDNFLISASGHLKISDFGLAFDGHWSHDASYYDCHRYSILMKLGIHVEGDDVDKRDEQGIQASLKWAQNLISIMEKHEKKTPDGEPLLN